MGPLGALTAAIFAAMGFVLLAGNDRSVDVANRLHQKGLLRVLDPQEMQTLSKYMLALLAAENISTPLAINQRYQKGRLNLYVINAGQTGSADSVARGNAAYVASSDIVFIDSTYFDFGQARIFETAPNELDQKVLAPLRVHAFFVLAHELGHRQLHSSSFSFSALTSSIQREAEADRFAIAALKKLYVGDTTRKNAGIPEPVSGLLGISGQETPLQRLADHIGYSVNFIADDIFNSPFPILTGSGTHGAFFDRMRALLDALDAEAQSTNDTDAQRHLSVTRSVIAGTDYLISLGPTEIEFDKPFDYAYLDQNTLFIVGPGDAPLIQIPLKDLARNRQIRRKLPWQKGPPVVRYAWAGPPERTFILRRDGEFVIANARTGAVVHTHRIEKELGDNSCVRQFILPPQPNPYAYVSYCVASLPYVTLINSVGGLEPRSMDTILRAQGENKADPTVRVAHSFDLDAAGHPTINYASGDKVFRLALTDELKSVTSAPLALKPADLPKPVYIGPARVVPKATVSDETGRSYYFSGSPIFRDISLHDAENDGHARIASVIPGIAGDGRLSERLQVAASYSIQNNRLIASLTQGGAYLVDFERRALSPLRRRGLGAMEQIVANARGDWIYYRKYEQRIVVFRG